MQRPGPAPTPRTTTTTTRLRRPDLGAFLRILEQASAALGDNEELLEGLSPWIAPMTGDDA